MDDFIGVFPNAVPSEYCDKVIAHYEDMATSGRTIDRRNHEGTDPMKKDNNIYYFENEFDPVVTAANSLIVQDFCSAAQSCYQQYAKEYGVLFSLAQHNISDSISIQKNTPKQGYHVWHCEHGNVATGRRLLMVLLYLNDVEQGGETEWLYQSKRVNATKGTMVISPSGFTHTHRGNPPLSGDKYIITTWIEFVQ